MKDNKNEIISIRDLLKNASDSINEARQIIGKGEMIELEKSISEKTMLFLGILASGGLDTLAIYSGGVVGFSAPGITSGLKAIGKFAFGGMRTGLCITIAFPIAACLGVAAISARLNRKQINQETKRIYTEIDTTILQINAALSNDTYDGDTAIRLNELREELAKIRTSIECLFPEKGDEPQSPATA